MLLLQRNTILKIKYAYLSPKNIYYILIINRRYKTYSGMSLAYLSHSYNQSYGKEENNGKELDIACNSGIAVGYTISRN